MKNKVCLIGTYNILILFVFTPRYPLFCRGKKGVAAMFIGIVTPFTPFILYM